jgi:dihydroorotase
MITDFLIKNGTVVDPSSGMYGRYDVMGSDGKITAIYPNTMDKSATDEIRVIDAEGCIVTPGLIDIHTHVFPQRAVIGIEADQIGVNQGVTTLVDAGSAGADTFAPFVAEVVEKSTTRVLSWLNIAIAGLCGSHSELADLTGINTAYTAEVIRKNPLIRGVKVRMSSSVLGASGLKPLEIAKQVAKEVQLPVMVHVGNGPPALGNILDLLEEGDVVTHAFHGKKGGIFSEKLELIPQAEKALSRKVLFDVGHGTDSFSFQTLKVAKAAGVNPYTISTDLYGKNYHGPVYSLATTMSKFLTLGYSLQEVIAAVTIAPAKVLGLQDSLGVLAVGRSADISILKIVEGEFRFADSVKNCLIGQQLLQPKYTIRLGKVWKCI